MKYRADNSIETVVGTLSVLHHFGEGWSAYGSLPVGHVTVNPAGGGDPGRGAGLADIIVGARYDFTALYDRHLYVPGVAFRLGLALPSGAQTSFGGSFSGAITKELIAIGFGAFTLFPALDIWIPVDPKVTLTIPIRGRIPLQRSPNGILFPPQVEFGVGVSSGLTEWLTLAARFAGRYRPQANEEGTGVLVNSGRMVLAGELDLGFKISDRVRLIAMARVPFYTYARGQQVVETFSTSLSVSVTFDGNDDDEDDEDDEDEATTTVRAGTATGAGEPGKADTRHIARGGKTFDIRDAFVEGKVSVLDYWAEWCKPCKKLSKELDALAAKTPYLAIRKVEVPDFDTPVAKQYLPGVKKMPNVWIYAPDGTLIHKLSGVPNNEVMNLVKAALKRYAPKSP